MALLCVAPLVLGSPDTLAYEFELSASYRSVETNAVSTIEIEFLPGIPPPPGFPTSSTTYFKEDDKQRWLSATYFLKPVVAENGPTQESAFLGMASSASLSYANHSSDRRSRSEDLLDLVVVNESTVLSNLESDEFSFMLHLVIPGSHWIGDIGYSRRDLQAIFDRQANRFESDIDRYTFGIGKYIGPKTTLTAVYNRTDETFRQIIATNNGDQDARIELRSETITLEARHLLAAGSRSHIALESSLGASSTSGPSFIDDWHGVYELGATFYPIDPLAIGIKVNGTFDKHELATDETNYSLICRWFHTKSFAIGVGYQFTDFENTGNVTSTDRDGYVADITVRF